ncbi:hypothetical protein [Acrocarpospora catenulata]|uniref:hypothetical protein n=1 Tax=Acrocarpospora catenulata TaxID=2836182 RepID=UPI001BDB057E|nr:hypothetical protein [Acrocarpospora catenulata]
MASICASCGIGQSRHCRCGSCLKDSNEPSDHRDECTTLNRRLARLRREGNWFSLPSGDPYFNRNT